MKGKNIKKRGTLKYVDRSSNSTSFSHAAFASETFYTCLKITVIIRRIFRLYNYDSTNDSFKLNQPNTAII